MYRSLDDLRRLADGLSNLGVVAVDEGRLEEAAALFEESIALDRRFDNRWGMAQTLCGQAALALARGRADESAALLSEAVEVMGRLDDRPSLIRTLDPLAATASVRGDHLLAARLWGAATTHREEIGEPRTVGEAAAVDRHLDVSRAALGSEGFSRAAATGSVLELETVLAEALRP